MWPLQQSRVLAVCPDGSCLATTTTTLLSPRSHDTASVSCFHGPASGSSGSTCLLDPSSGRWSQLPTGCLSATTCAAFTPDSAYLVLAGSRGRGWGGGDGSLGEGDLILDPGGWIQVLDHHVRRVHNTWPSGSAHVNCLAVTADGAQLVSIERAGVRV